ncbi:MAG: hypothetical protein K0Q95_801 [Bacteroidota bacterium]|jgi:hypothetical protein|nr:hypothetical protein [Bacteroidota bacterium]
MRKKTVLILACMLLAFIACRKEFEKPSWDTNVLAPLVSASMNINNILPDSILQENADSSMKILFEGDIYKISMDTLFNIPDTTLKNSFTIPFGNPSFAPGATVINNSISETTYNLGGPQLRKIIIKRGFVKYSVKSKIHEKTHFLYKIPCAKLNGVPFQIDVEVPAGTASAPGLYNQTFDLSGYEIDLTGLNQNRVNTIYTSLTASISTSAAGPVTVSNTDSLIIENKFYDLFPYYAKGFFGTNTFNVGPEQTAFTLFNRIVDGTLRLEDVDFQLKLENPIGLDARIFINDLTSVNSRTGNSIPLANAIINAPININRASESGSTVNPTYANFPLTTSNSNIKEMIENLPDHFGYSMQLTTNPMGNVSGSNDFIYSDQLLKAKLNMEIPLSLIATNLALVDTLDLNIQTNSESQNLHSGNITLVANNGFPFDASVQLYLLDDYNNIKDSLYMNTNTIDQGLLNTNLRVTHKKTTRLSTPVNEAKMDLLYNTKKVMLKVKFNTASQTQYVKIYSDYSIDIQIIGDINYTIQLK